MKKMLQELREVSVNAILQAQDAEALESLRVKYLGKKGELTKILKQMGKLSAEERPAMGQLANQVRRAGGGHRHPPQGAERSHDGAPAQGRDARRDDARRAQ